MTDAVPTAEGHVITFYSYKGGTGRSMALANVAWILASSGKRVLVIDWDLEAPGIHRYFHPFLKDKNLASSDGLMEFLLEYVSQALTPRDGEPVDDGWFSAQADIVEYAQSLRWAQFPKPGTIDFVPAGRQSDSYATTVNLFNWHQFYDKLGGERFFDEAKKHMQADYDYILIDSRTGVSDTSGICTIQMPETVVLCFTLNIQSIEGAAAVAETIEREQQRRGREIRILPIPTRVDRSEKERLELARVEAWRRFDRFLSHLTPQERTEYWGVVEVPYEPWYAYEEVLSIFGDRTRVQTSILAAMETLTSHVSAGAVTDFKAITEAERKRVLKQYLRGSAGEPHDELVDVATRADSALARVTAPLQAKAMATILRLAEISANGTATPRRVNRADLGDVPDRVMQTLRYADLIVETRQPDGSDIVELSTPDILRDWTRLQRAMEEDMPFLLWRQQLSSRAAEWKRSGKRAALLSGNRLAVTRHYLRRADDLNAEERALIAASERRSRAALTLAAVVLLAVIAAGSAWLTWTNSDAYQADQVFKKVPIESVGDSAEAEDAVGQWIRALVSSGRVVEAQRVARAAGTLSQKGVRNAVLATALNDRNEIPAATEAVRAATDALAKIDSPAKQARAQIDVANLLSAKYRETATRLLFEAKQSATYYNDKKGARHATEDAVAALTLSRDLIVSLQRLGIGSQATEMASDAEAILKDLPLDERARWLLALGDALERARGKGLATAMRRDALELLAASEPGYFELFLPAVRSLTRNADAENCALVLDFLRRHRPRSNDVYDATGITLRALARWRTLRPDDKFWQNAEALVRSLPPAERDEMVATLAAALAACGDTARADKLISEIIRQPTTIPASASAISAALSEAYCRKGDSTDAKKFRDEAVQQGLLEPDVTLQSDALMKAAMAAARCGDAAAAARIAGAAPQTNGRSRQLPELIVAIADSARAATDADALASAKLIVVLAPQADRDPPFLNAVASLAAAAKWRAAFEVVKAMETEEMQYRGLRELVSALDEHMDTDVLHDFAIAMKNPYYASLVLLMVAEQRPHSPIARKALHEAEDRVRSAEKQQQSEIYHRIADGYAREGNLRAARLAGLNCTNPVDQLSAFAQIVSVSAANQTASASR